MGTAITFLITLLTSSTNAYRWSVIDADITDICNNQICGSSPHSVCLAVNENFPTSQCLARRFEWMKIGPTEIRGIVDGHNGLRNRVARSHFQPVSDMNLLYWDKDLQLMAEGWIGQCIVDRLDPCQFICESGWGASGVVPRVCIWLLRELIER